MINEAEALRLAQARRGEPNEGDDDDFYANLLFESMVTTSTTSFARAATSPDADGTAQITRALYSEAQRRGYKLREQELRERELHADRASDDDMS